MQKKCKACETGKVHDIFEQATCEKFTKINFIAGNSKREESKVDAKIAYLVGDKKESLTRLDRAIDLVEVYGAIRRTDIPGVYIVASQHKANVFYCVYLNHDDGRCQCPDYVHRHIKCKHILAASAWQKGEADLKDRADVPRKKVISR